MTELMKALINIYYPPAIKQQRLSGTFSAPLIRGSAQCVSISHPSHSYLCMLQTPWIPRRTIFPRLMPHPDVQCLLDLQLGVPLLQPRGSRSLHDRAPYFQVIEKA